MSCQHLYEYTLQLYVHDLNNKRFKEKAFQINTWETQAKWAQTRPSSDISL